MSRDYRAKNHIDLCMEVQHPDGQPLAFIETSAIYNDIGLYKIVHSEINRCSEDAEIIQASNDINIIAQEHWPSLVAFFNCYVVQQRRDCLVVIPLRSPHQAILSKYFAPSGE
jgi:hypothetical protein